jgi:hypothetical protein
MKTFTWHICTTVNCSRCIARLALHATLTSKWSAL